VKITCLLFPLPLGGLTLSINSSGSDNGSASQVFISEVEATDCDDMDYEEPRIPRKRKAY